MIVGASLLLLHLSFVLAYFKSQNLMIKFETTLKHSHIIRFFTHSHSLMFYKYFINLIYSVFFIKKIIYSQIIRQKNIIYYFKYFCYFNIFLIFYYYNIYFVYIIWNKIFLNYTILYSNVEFLTSLNVSWITNLLLYSEVLQLNWIFRRKKYMMCMYSFA
jgi:hypothetical protein